MNRADRLFGGSAGIVRDRDFQVLLLAGSLTAPLGVSLVSPLLDALIGPLGASPTSIGLLVAAYTAPALVAVPASGLLSDRVGRKPVLVGGLLVFGVAGLAIALAPDLRVAIALRVLQGVGFAGITPIVVTSIGDLFRGADAATGQGLRIAATGGAQTVFPPIAAALVGVAWQLPFAIYGLALPLAVFVAVGLEEPAGRDGPTGGRDGDAGYGRALWRLITRPRVVALIAAYIGPAFLYFGFHAVIAILVARALGGTPAETGVLVALFSIVYATAATQAGRVAGRFGSRAGPLLATNLTMAVGVVVLAFAPTLPVALAGAAGFGAGFGVTTALYRGILPEFAPESLRGGLVSMGEGLSRASSTAAPVVMGAAVELASPSLGFAVALRWTIVAVGLGVAVTGIIGVVAARVDAPRPQASPAAEAGPGR